MKNYVENQSLGKFFRTIGYILIFVATSLISMTILFDSNTEIVLIDTIRETLQPIQDVVLTVDFLQDGFYQLLFFYIGMVLIFWTLVKSTFVKLLQTLIFTGLFVLIFYSKDMSFIPITFTNPDWMVDALAMVDSYLDPVLSLNEFVAPLAALVGTLVIWQLFATKKPKRIATFFLRAGSVVLFLAVLSIFATKAFEEFFDTSIFDTVRSYLYIVSYDFFILGSAFGILGFMRK